MKQILTIIFIFVFSAAAFGAAFVVNNNGDTTDANSTDNLCSDVSGNCTLRAAIEQANALAGDDTITFDFAALLTTITLMRGQLEITSNITITGTGARNLIISGNNASRVFFVHPASAGSSFVVNIVNISGLTVANGYVAYPLAGGGIYTINGATLNLTEVTVRNNTAGHIGGGIFQFLGTINILNSTISYNTAVSDGGGINNNAGTTNISNTTISDNTAPLGAGIVNFRTLTLNNVTISNNTATTFGGGVYNAASARNAFTVRNSIIANNTAPNGADVYREFTSLGNNLIGNSTGSTSFTNGVNGDIVGTAAAPINPLLGALQDNGGQTDTRALLPGSPAINAGNNADTAATDQRGFARIVSGTIDIGAYELIPNKSQKRIRFFDTQ
jgi:predicted outer membrane repeat protein